MTKKQAKDIARMWVGFAAANYGTDSFMGMNLSHEDEKKIMDQVDSIYGRLTKGLPLKRTLHEIINYVVNERKNTTPKN